MSMIGSVRARLTIAVAVIVGGVALAGALIAPRVVHNSLIADRLDAQRELEQGDLATSAPLFDRATLEALDPDMLTWLYGEDVVDLTDELDAVDGLSALREYDARLRLHVLAGHDVIATVTVDGRVSVRTDPTREMRSPVVSRQRLERLAADLGVDRRLKAPFPRVLDGATTFEALLDEFATQFGFDVGEHFDPRLFEGLPDLFGDELFPRELFEILDDPLPTIEEDPPTLDASELIVGTRTIDGRAMLLTASTDGIDKTVARIRTLLWFGAPVAVAAAALLTWLLAGRSLRPVGAITERTRQIRSSTLHERVPVPRSHDEIAALATEMNTMLDRVQREDERRRQFVSDASHELRSPIATIRAQAEAALTADTGQDDDAHALAEGVLAEAERMSVLVDDLLSLARHDEQLAPPGVIVDLDDIVYAAATRPRRVPVDVSGVSAGQVRGRADELARVVTHLLDNAARHAASQVAVTLRAANGEVELIVDDDGDGIAPEQREWVFERFVRLDDARSRDFGGAGLGLAVVDTVIRSMGGTIVAEDSPFGGARFRAEFPPV